MSSTNPITPLEPASPESSFESDWGPDAPDHDNGLYDPGIVTAVLKIQYMWYLYREYQAMVQHVRGFKEFQPTFAQFFRSMKPFELREIGWTAFDMDWILSIRIAYARLAVSLPVESAAIRMRAEWPLQAG